MSWLKPREQIHPSLFLFYSGPQQIGWRPSPLMKVIFTQSVDSNANYLSMTSSRTHSETVSYQLFEHSFAQAGWYIKLTITVTITLVERTWESYYIRSYEVKNVGTYITKWGISPASFHIREFRWVFCGAANLWSHSAAKAAAGLGADPPKAA